MCSKVKGARKDGPPRPSTAPAVMLCNSPRQEERKSGKINPKDDAERGQATPMEEYPEHNPPSEGKCGGKTNSQI